MPKKIEGALPPEYAGKPVIHVVRRGDTVYKLAKAYGCRAADILEANHIPDVYDLRIGQELVIPAR